MSSVDCEHRSLGEKNSEVGQSGTGLSGAMKVQEKAKLRKRADENK